MGKQIFVWALRLIAAIILLQTLYFKFTAQPESVLLFTILGMEPWGRIGTGLAELVAAWLLLYPRTTGIGALMALGLMSGAIFFHLTRLGINFGGNALLFIYAVVVWTCSLVLLILYKDQVLKLISFKQSS
jgi:uncharacterized membrane protein YphA (DoxX/SURF4 family)